MQKEKAGKNKEKQVGSKAKSGIRATSKPKSPSKKEIEQVVLSNGTEEAIRDGLRSIGAYSPSVEHLITSCAQLIQIRDKIYKEIETTAPMIQEESREGAVRQKANPIYGMYMDISKELRVTLAELTMTVRSSTISTTDGLADLDNSLSGIVY